MLKEMLRKQFDTTAISVQVLPFNTWNKDGEYIEARQLVVLDAEDKFMFVIGYAAADEYIVDGYVNYEKIYKDYILTEKEWEETATESQKAKATEEENWQAMPADENAVLK